MATQVYTSLTKVFSKSRGLRKCHEWVLGKSHMVKKGFLPQMSITKKQREYPGICSQNCQGVVIKGEKSMNA